MDEGCSTRSAADDAGAENASKAALRGNTPLPFWKRPIPGWILWPVVAVLLVNRLLYVAQKWPLSVRGAEATWFPSRNDEVHRWLHVRGYWIVEVTLLNPTPWPRKAGIGWIEFGDGTEEALLPMAGFDSRLGLPSVPPDSRGGIPRFSARRIRYFTDTEKPPMMKPVGVRFGMVGREARGKVTLQPPGRLPDP
jgi:hypothetical protein